MSIENNNTVENMDMEDVDALVEVCLNHEGQDYLVVVPLATANILLNDPEEAKQFIENQVMVNQAYQSEQRLVWVSKKPTQKDHEATQFFLQLRENYSAQFNDKKTTKTQIWAIIAKRMNEAGYYVGEGRDAIEKCRMKFANMQKQYLQYIKHTKTTGVEHKDPPPYFEDIHKILGGHDKVDPVNLQDTQENTPPQQSFDDSQIDKPGPSGSDCSSSTTSSIKTRFSTARSVKPVSANAQLINVLKEQHNDRQNNFRKLENLLETQNNQRERLLQQLQSLIEIQNKRRGDSDCANNH